MAPEAIAVLPFAVLDIAFVFDTNLVPFVTIGHEVEDFAEYIDECRFQFLFEEVVCSLWHNCLLVELFLFRCPYDVPSGAQDRDNVATR